METLTLVIGDSAGDVLSGIVSLALLLPGLGLCVRRLHDVGKNGWFLLLALLPIIGWIILLIWYVKPSEPMPNQYGVVPNTVA